MLRKYLSAALILLASSVYAQNGNYMSFQTPGHVEMYNYSSLNSLQSGTISFWFKVNDLDQNAIFFSASNKQNISASNELVIKYIESTYSIQTLVVQSGVIAMDAYIPNNSITDNNWHNYTLVSDNTGTIQIYIDGVAQTLSAGTCCGGTTNDYFFGDITGLSSMKIGMLERDVKYSFGSFSIDDFRIWDKAFSGSEVTSTIASVSTPPVANLVVYYTFETLEDLSVGTAGTNDVRDQTGNTVHGDVSGGTTTPILNKNASHVSVISYPNPVEDQISIDLDVQGSEIIKGVLVSTSGLVLMSWSDSVNGKYVKQLDVAALPAGVYFIQFTGATLNETVKFVK